MKRVAAPMVGGLVTSAFLTLEVIPVLYTIWRARQLAAGRGFGRGTPAAPATAPTEISTDQDRQASAASVG
jgi:hypothetical protein